VGVEAGGGLEELHRHTAAVASVERARILRWPLPPLKVGAAPRAEARPSNPTGLGQATAAAGFKNKQKQKYCIKREKKRLPRLQPTVGVKANTVSHLMYWNEGDAQKEGGAKEKEKAQKQDQEPGR